MDHLSTNQVQFRHVDIDAHNIITLFICTKTLHLKIVVGVFIHTYFMVNPRVYHWHIIYSSFISRTHVVKNHNLSSDEDIATTNGGERYFGGNTTFFIFIAVRCIVLTHDKPLLTSSCTSSKRLIKTNLVVISTNL